MYGRISVPSYGPRDAEVALLGQSPGREEELLGRPFVGPAGRFARRVFEEAGYEWESIYRFNVFSKRLLSVKDRNALMRDIVASRERIERRLPPSET
jgi:uracil-DNA glycosylase family 4